MFENVKKNVPSNPSQNFVHNFLFQDLNLKWIFGDETLLNFPTLLCLIFFEKNYPTMPK